MTAVLLLGLALRTAAPPGAPEFLPDGGLALSPKELLRRLDEMKEQLKGRPKTAEIEFALGNLYYDNARWPDAIDYYRQLRERAEAPLRRYLALRAKTHTEPKLGQAKCDSARGGTFDELVAAGERLEQAGRLPNALRCYEAGLLPVAIALTRQGNAWYLIGNNALAEAAHRRALDLIPDDPDSLFFLGAILFEGGEGKVAQLRQAQAYWEQYLRVVADGDPDRARLVKRDLVRLQAAVDNQGKIPPDPAR